MNSDQVPYRTHWYGYNCKRPASRHALWFVTVVILTVSLSSCDTAGSNDQRIDTVLAITSPATGNVVDVYDILSAVVTVSETEANFQVSLSVVLPDSRIYTESQNAEDVSDELTFEVAAPFSEIPPTDGKDDYEYAVQLIAFGTQKDGSVITDTVDVTVRVFREFFPLDVGAKWEFEYDYHHHYTHPDFCGADGQDRTEEGVLKWSVVQRKEVTGCVECTVPNYEYTIVENFQGTRVTSIAGERCTGWNAGGYTPPTPFEWERELIFLETDSMIVIQPGVTLFWDGHIYLNWGEIEFSRKYGPSQDTLRIIQGYRYDIYVGSIYWTLGESEGPIRVHEDYEYGRNGRAERILTLRQFTPAPDN